MSSISERPRVESLESGLIIKNPLSSPWVLRAGDGRIVCLAATDEGFNYEKGRQEDSLAVKAGKDEQSGKKWFAFINADGVGDDPEGDQASHYVARSLATNMSGETDLRDFHEATHNLMQSEGFKGSAANYQASRIEEIGTKKKVVLSPAWDGQLIIIGKDEKIRHMTKRKRYYENGKEYISQWVEGDKLTTIDDPYEIELFDGDRLISATDFLWDIFTPEEVVKMISGRSIEDAFRIISVATELAMTTGLPKNIADLISGKPTDEAINLMQSYAKRGSNQRGKADNRTLLIFDN